MCCYFVVGCRGEISIWPLRKPCVQPQIERTKSYAKTRKTWVCQCRWLQLLQVGLLWRLICLACLCDVAFVLYRSASFELIQSYLKSLTYIHHWFPMPRTCSSKFLSCSSACELPVRRLAGLLGNEEAALSRFTNLREINVGKGAVAALKHQPSTKPLYAAGGKKLPIMLATVKVGSHILNISVHRLAFFFWNWKGMQCCFGHSPFIIKSGTLAYTETLSRFSFLPHFLTILLLWLLPKALIDKKDLFPNGPIA